MPADVTAPKGSISTAGRNTGMLPPIDDIDFTAIKRFTIKERAGLEISLRAANIFNHPQYVAAI